MPGVNTMLIAFGWPSALVRTTVLASPFPILPTFLHSPRLAPRKQERRLRRLEEASSRMRRKSCVSPSIGQAEYEPPTDLGFGRPALSSRVVDIRRACPPDGAELTLRTRVLFPF